MAFANLFTNCDSPLAVHRKLLTLMCCEYLDSESCRQYFTRFMLNCRVHLNTPRERRLCNAHEICDALESKGLLGVGNYNILREMVADVHADLIYLIDETEAKIVMFREASDDPICKRQRIEHEPLMDDDFPDNHVKYLMEVLRKMNFKTTQRIQVSPLMKGSKTLPIDQIFAPVVLRNDSKNQKIWQDLKGKSSSGKNLLNCPHDIFYHDKEAARYVFVLGEAGRGKTVFCQQLLRHWCAANHKSENEELSDWEKVMSEFDYVFLVSLRHVEGTRTCVQDMICQDACKSHKECHDAIHHVLSNDRYRCLVIVDGLDEWKVPPDVRSKLTFDGVPNIDSTSRCTFLFTFRPWKFDAVVDMVSANDNVIEICGITEYGIELTIENMLLNYYGMDSSTQEFSNLKKEMLRKAKDSKMKTVVEIPLLLTAAVQLWYEKRQATSMTSFYAAMVQLLIKRTMNAKSLGKETIEKLCENTKSTQFVELPELLKCKPYKTIGTFSSVLCILGKLAYEDLVSQETHLVFSREELDDRIGKDNLEFALAVGLLSQCEAPGCFDEENVSVNFFHKTMQEFLAAFFMSISKNVLAAFVSKHLSNLTEILELSNVILFACGLSLQMGSMLIEQVKQVSESDSNVLSWRKNFSYEDKHKTIQTFKLLKSCQEEMKHTKTQTNNTLSLFHYLPDVFVEDTDDEQIVWRDIVEIISVKPNTLVSLFMSVDYINQFQSQAVKDLTYILTNENSLSYLCIYGFGRTLGGISTSSVIKTLRLDKVNLTCEFIYGLAKSLELHRDLQHLSLTWIKCKSIFETEKDGNEGGLYDQNIKTADHQTTDSSKEEILYHRLHPASLCDIFYVLPKCLSLIQLRINYRSLCTEEERLAFLRVLSQLPMLQEVRYIGTKDHNYDVDEFDEHDDVIARRPRDDKFDIEVARILSNMPRLKQLDLRGVSIGENLFQLSTNMSEIKHIDLHEVYMSNESWCKFIESLTRLNHRFLVELSFTGIYQHEKPLVMINTSPLFTVESDSMFGSHMENNFAPDRFVDHIRFIRSIEHVKANS